jgi:hypothetical protein
MIFYRITKKTMTTTFHYTLSFHVKSVLVLLTFFVCHTRCCNKVPKRWVHHLQWISYVVVGSTQARLDKGLEEKREKLSWFWARPLIYHKHIITIPCKNFNTMLITNSSDPLKEFGVWRADVGSPQNSCLLLVWAPNKLWRRPSLLLS